MRIIARPNADDTAMVIEFEGFEWLQALLGSTAQQEASAPAVEQENSAPAPEPEPTISFEEMKAEAGNLMTKLPAGSGNDFVADILKEFGAEKARDLKEKQYQPFLDRLQEAIEQHA